MSDPDAQETPEPVNWRSVCAAVGWAGLLVAFLAAYSIFGRALASSVGLALGGGGMRREDAEALTRDAGILALAVCAIAGLALFPRGWILSTLASILFLACLILVSGDVSTR